MKIKCISKLSLREEAEALILPYFRGEKGLALVAYQEMSLSKWGKDSISLGDFRGELGEIFLLHPKGIKEKRVILLGLGDKKGISTESLRRAYAKAVQFCHQHKIKKVNIMIPKLKLPYEEIIQGTCEGIFLSNYVFDQLKSISSKKTCLMTHCHWIGVPAKDIKLFTKWKNLSEGVCFARDLVNGNADEIDAQALGRIAKKLAVQFPKVNARVFDKKRLEKENLNLILTVNRASKVDPSLIILEYNGNPKGELSTAVVGKGVTYDSGGIQLKPRSGNLIHMKCDMSGAAAVLGIIYAVAKLDLRLNIVGVIPACENAIGPEAYKPGDVYESYLGKTVEIMSTDAEGRLILADALAYTQKKFNPDHLIDLATLTGGVVAALGDQLTGVMTNSPNLMGKIMGASKKSGEKVWELPLYGEYMGALKSSIADLKNSSITPGYPSAIVAGLFLQEFVKSTSWAHLDIAGTAYLRDPQHYQRTKATGVGVRLVIAFLEDLLES